MEMEVISREIIKPSSPTPPHLKIYPLSFLDHVFFSNYTPVVFFYSNNNGVSEEERSKQLKKSLSQVLAMYYPFAGRLRDRASIDCNDKGVTLVFTRSKGNLSDYIQNPNEEFLKSLFPNDDLQWKEMDPLGILLVVQVNHFAGGGIAISVCLSHKVADGSTIFNFVKDWATITRNFKCSSEEEKEGEIVLPRLDGASIFPLGDLPNYPELAFGKIENTICKRFILDASKIQSLKAKVSQRVKSPTRVQVASALIYKSAISALSSTFQSPNQTTWLRFATNLRPRMVPPIPEKTVGDMVWFFTVSATKEVELHELVSKIQQGLFEFCDEHVKHFGRNDMSFISKCLKESTSVNPEYDNLVLFDVFSWCRFPIYEADFGSGKPIWVTTTCLPVKNNIIIMDTRDGEGIEVLVNMKEQDMTLFEQNVELLQYASVNPSVV